MDLLEEAKRIQKDRGLTDKQMSDLLGYKYRTDWARIKGGAVPANKSFQMRTMKAFPELASTYAQSLQEGKRGALKSLLDRLVLRVKKFV